MNKYNNKDNEPINLNFNTILDIQMIEDSLPKKSLDNLKNSNLHILLFEWFQRKKELVFKIEESERMNETFMSWAPFMSVCSFNAKENNKKIVFLVNSKDAYYEKLWEHFTPGTNNYFVCSQIYEDVLPVNMLFKSDDWFVKDTVESVFKYVFDSLNVQSSKNN